MAGTFGSERIERLERVVLWLLRARHVVLVAGAVDRTLDPYTHEAY